MRAINYQVKGYPPSTLLTSLTDAEAYPANELIALYHERWELETPSTRSRRICLIDRNYLQPHRRGRTPGTVGIAIAYNLVRLEMERIAKEIGVPPTRISFVAAVMLCQNHHSDRCAVVSDRIRWEISRATSMISVGTSRGLSCQSVDESALTHDK